MDRVVATTHTAGHLLDVFIARTYTDLQFIALWRHLSDHSLIVAHVSSREGLERLHQPRLPYARLVRHRQLHGRLRFVTAGYDATDWFITSLPDTAEQLLFDLYFDTLSNLFDRQTQRVSVLDAQNHGSLVNVTNSEDLERAYRRVRSESSLAESRSHFHN